MSHVFVFHEEIKQFLRDHNRDTVDHSENISSVTHIADVVFPNLNELNTSAQNTRMNKITVIEKFSAFSPHFQYGQSASTKEILPSFPGWDGIRLLMRTKYCLSRVK